MLRSSIRVDQPLAQKLNPLLVARQPRLPPPQTLSNRRLHALMFHGAGPVRRRNGAGEMRWVVEFGARAPRMAQSPPLDSAGAHHLLLLPILLLLNLRCIRRIV